MKSKQAFLTLLKSKLFWLAILFIASFNYLYEKAPTRIDYTLDICLPWSWWITYSEFDESKHQYILFVPKKDKYTQKANYLMKYVGCKGGQVLETKGLEYYCDGKHISTAKKFDMALNPLNQFVYNGVIPKDKFFAIATHPFAYDSKYFGFVDRNQIVRGAKPLEF